MASYLDEWNIQQKAVRDKERQNKNAATAGLNMYHGGEHDIKEHDKALKDFRLQQRQRQESARKFLGAYQDGSNTISRGQEVLTRSNEGSKSNSTDPDLQENMEEGEAPSMNCEQDPVEDYLTGVNDSDLPEGGGLVARRIANRLAAEEEARRKAEEEEERRRRDLVGGTRWTGPEKEFIAEEEAGTNEAAQREFKKREQDAMAADANKVEKSTGEEKKLSSIERRIARRKAAEEEVKRKAAEEKAQQTRVEKQSAGPAIVEEDKEDEEEDESSSPLAEQKRIEEEEEEEAEVQAVLAAVLLEEQKRLDEEKRVPETARLEEEKGLVDEQRRAQEAAEEAKQKAANELDYEVAQEAKTAKEEDEKIEAEALVVGAEHKRLDEGQKERMAEEQEKAAEKQNPPSEDKIDESTEIIPGRLRRTVLEFSFGLIYPDADPIPDTETCLHAAENILPNTLPKSKELQVTFDSDSRPTVSSVEKDGAFAKDGSIRYIVKGSYAVFIMNNEEPKTATAALRRSLQTADYFRHIKPKEVVDENETEGTDEIVVGKKEGNQWRRIRAAAVIAFEDIVDDEVPMGCAP
jgi:hypothetical protein